MLHQRVSQRQFAPTSLKMWNGTGPSPTVNTSVGATDIAVDNSYEMIGHDAGAVTFTRTAGTATNPNMLGRTYQVTETGTIGTVTLYFDNALFTANGAGQFLAYSNQPGVGIPTTFVPLIASGGGYTAQVDFPAGTSYFTITIGNSIKGPAGISNGLVAWYMAERGVNTPGGVTAWSDLSGFGRTLANVGPAGNVRKWKSNNVGWTRFISSRLTTNAFGTAGTFSGKTIVTAIQGFNGGASDGLLGFDTQGGLFSDASGQIQLGGGAASWSTGGGSLQQNAGNITVATTPVSSWSVMTSTRLAAMTAASFRIGNYSPSTNFDSVRVGEVAIFSTTLAAGEQDRLESYMAIKYGITLSGRYYASNWNGTTGTVLYTPMLYNQEIIGIGRDDNAGLTKRQSKSADKNDVLSISLGGTAANDSLNTAAFFSDLSYLVVGHDAPVGGGVSCLSTNKINTPTEPNDHIRIERTWKMMKTGSWAGSPTVEFQVDVANPNADIAALPPTSTNYYLYVSTDSMFQTGVAFYQMTFSANRWKFSLTDAQIPAGKSFFTIGTKLNKASFDAPSVCYGASIKNYGSNLADASICSMMSFDDGSASLYKTVRAAGIAAHTYTVVDLPGGCIDTINWTVPVNLPPGTYNVLIDDSATLACDSTIFGTPSYGLGKGLLRQLTVNAGEKALLSWGSLGDTLYCVGEPSLTAVKGTGCTLGSLQFVSSNNPAVTNLTWVNLLIADTVFSSSTFATIMVHAGDTGTHVIRFVTRGGTPCKDTLTFRFRIKPSIATSIAYTGSPYCGGDAAVYLPNLGSTAVFNSKFSSAPPLSPTQLDTLSGQPFIPNITVPGTYVITYRPPLGQCALPSSTSITVVAATRADFNYLQDHYCKNGGSTAPWIANRPSTGFFEVAPGSPGGPGGISLNPATGAIDLALSTPDTFYIQYNVNAAGCTYNSLDTVIIDAAPNANFLVNTIDTICIGLGTRAISYFAGGTFSSVGNYFTVVVPDSFTANTAGGPFYLQYKLSNAFCTDSTQRLIWVKGQQSATIQYDSINYCTNVADPYPVFLSGTSGGNFLSTPGLSITDSTGQIDVSASTPGAYVISYETPDPTCPDTVLVGTVNIQSVSPAAFDLVADSICDRSGVVPIDVVPPTNNNFSVWHGLQQFAGAIVTANSIDIDTLDPGGPYEIRNIRTNAFCSDTAYDYVVINPLDLANIQFSPPVICVGDFNPYPQILGDGGGSFTNVTPGITVDPDTGIVSITGVGFYTVEYTTVGTCPSSDTATVEVRLKIPADFSYPLLKFCSSYPDSILPDMIASPGQGLFSSDSSVTINGSTGYIDLSQTASGTHNISYTIIQTGACADLEVVTLTIVAPDTMTSISLPVDSFCFRATDTVQVVVTGTQGGLFSADAGLVFSNADSGIVSLFGSDPSQFAHTITYTLPTVCDEDQFSTNIWIFPRDNPYFGYAVNAFCNRSSNPLPDTIATPGGTFSIFPPTSNVIQIINATGELQLDDNTGQGPVGVQYITSGGCPDTMLLPIRISNRPLGTDIDVKPDTVVCEGYTLELTASGGFFQYIYLGNNPIPIDTGDVHVFANLQDNDTIRVEFYTDLGCVVDTMVTIDVLPIPDQQVLNNPTIINSVDPFLVEMAPITSDSTYFIWYILDPIGGIILPNPPTGVSPDTVGVGQSSIINVPFTMPSGFVPAQFTFLVEPWSKGCRGPADTIYVRVNPEDLDIFVPQVMTPDGNGQNETWLIQWKDGIIPENYTILLYNEAGAKVYTMDGLTSDWGGGELPDGVYWYTLLGAEGELIEAAGLTIRRK